jgi:hypothetical protein
MYVTSWPRKQTSPLLHPAHASRIEDGVSLSCSSVFQLGDCR